MTLERLLSHWSSDPDITCNVAVWHNIPARGAKWEDIPDDIHPYLKNRLNKIGIYRLYSHQLSALRSARAGHHLVVVTGTASGKTLCYNLPVLDQLLKENDARALYLFPTKALAQDQENNLNKLIGDPKQDNSHLKHNNLPVAIYDGDTPTHVRASIRSNARLILSNPDMLHTGILPHHTAWAKFFSLLRYVVIDEMHVYRGIFGSHVSNVIRRLKRVAGFYGAIPQFILTSATIANPEELARQLIEPETNETTLNLVTDDGSALGPKSFIIYNPPIINKELGLRRSALQESVRLANDLLAYNVQSILFSRTRRSVELILTYLRQQTPFTKSTLGLDTTKTESSESIRGYRSGYLPKQRRAIIHGLRQGEVRAVVATNALELGIDIGKMDAAILVGYPGTIAATWQQAGRAGRGEDLSLAVMVASADPLDQFLAAHPEYFFDRSPEQALINPDNLLILLAHIRCASFELPFDQGEGFGNLDHSRLVEFFEFLLSEGVLYHSAGRYYWIADQYPAQSVSLRSSSPDNITLLNDDGETQTVIGQVDRASSFWMVHPQAIYLHEAQAFIVEDLNLEQNIARLQRIDTDYYTEPRINSTVGLLNLYQETPVIGGTKAYGEINVTTQVIGYRKIKWLTHELIGLGEVTLPPSELLTTGYWLTLSKDTVDSLRLQGLWTNDPNAYGANWPAQRDRARARDDYKCQVCGEPERNRAHDVHHKAPFRSFPGFLQANQLENLITLCPNCHRKVESIVRIRSGLAGLAYVLHHLAPLFIMCDTSDLGVHSDPQSPLAEGKPTVVFYDQVPAGIGLSQHLFELHDDLLNGALELVELCKCNDGCPSCVGPGGENGLGSKRETLALLQSLIIPKIS